MLRQLREKVRLAQVLLKMNQEGASAAGQSVAPMVRYARLPTLLAAHKHCCARPVGERGQEVPLSRLVAHARP